jgi:hypothetical protein
MTPTNDHDRLIDEALSLLRDAMAEDRTAFWAAKLHPAESNDVEERPFPVDAVPITKTVAVVETKRFDSVPAAQQSVTEQASQVSAPVPVQEQQGSLINKTLSMVAVAISESIAPEAPHLLHSPGAQQDKVKEDQAVSLIAEALSMVKGVTPAEPIRHAVGPRSLQPPTRPPGEGPATPSQGAIAEELTTEERLAMQRADMRERVEMFKANQERFKREREEYYAATMAKVRAAIHLSP